MLRIRCVAAAVNELMFSPRDDDVIDRMIRRQDHCLDRQTVAALLTHF